MFEILVGKIKNDGKGKLIKANQTNNYDVAKKLFEKQIKIEKENLKLWKLKRDEHIEIWLTKDNNEALEIKYID